MPGREAARTSLRFEFLVLVPLGPRLGAGLADNDAIDSKVVLDFPVKHRRDRISQQHEIGGAKLPLVKLSFQFVSQPLQAAPPASASATMQPFPRVRLGGLQRRFLIVRLFRSVARVAGEQAFQFTRSLPLVIDAGVAILKPGQRLLEPATRSAIRPAASALRASPPSLPSAA